MPFHHLARQLGNPSRPFDGSRIPKWERQEERLHPPHIGGGLGGGGCLLVRSLRQRMNEKIHYRKEIKFTLLPPI